MDKTRTILLGAAAGLAAGYAAVRALEAPAALRAPKRARRVDAASYGSVRRALSVSGIVRSTAGSATIAYGPLGTRIARSVRSFPVWLQPMLFTAQALLLDALLELPVEIVEGYALERRYDLSDQSASSWLTDHFKQTAIGGGIAVVLSGIFGAVVRRFPRSWPWIAGAGVLPLLVLANIVVPMYVMPLFNEYKPIEGPLERRLRALASRFGVGEAQILRMDMSKQTKKANAFVTGVAGTHRIVLGDTLIEHFPPEEIEFVVAHELGHYVTKDSWRMIAVGQMAALVVLRGSFAALRDDAGFEAQPALLAKIQWWSGLISQLLRPAVNAFARSREWAADGFALRATGDPRGGAAAFARLRDQNLAEDEQPGWYEFLFSTHPSLKARIEALQQSG